MTATQCLDKEKHFLYKQVGVEHNKISYLKNTNDKTFFSWSSAVYETVLAVAQTAGVKSTVHSIEKHLNTHIMKIVQYNNIWISSNLVSVLNKSSMPPTRRHFRWV